MEHARLHRAAMIGEDPEAGHGKGRVICGLSGGVDSSVAAVWLIHEAIGDQLTCIFVDTGMMRAGEGDRGGVVCSAAITTSR